MEVVDASKLTVPELLRCKRRLDREKGVARLEGILGLSSAPVAVPPARWEDMPDPEAAVKKPRIDGDDKGDAALADAEATVIAILGKKGETDDSWEAQHGALMAATTVVRTGRASEAFVTAVAKAAAALLDDGESRVRLEAGTTLAALCLATGPSTYEQYAEATIKSGIRDNLERGNVDASSSPDGTALLHESMGWKTLESSSRALLEIVKVLQSQFAPFLTAELLEVLFQSLKHTNRFVRETAYLVCAELTSVLGVDQAGVGEGLSTDAFVASMAPQLAIGLGDNWSQVRMAASVASRKFFLQLKEEDRKRYYGLLLPRMCLNRYYVAEGVRLYSQETWRLVAGDNGRRLVQTYIAETVEYYVSQTEADNHAVREAACACVAELGLKVDAESLRPHVERLLTILIQCFKDESWPVRDAASIASGRFIKCFPEESKPLMTEFYALFLSHVSDNIWSVRENAAVALASVVSAYGEESFDMVHKHMLEILPAAKAQKQQSTANAGLENVTQFGVAPPVVAGGVTRVEYKFGDADPMHTNQQVYSCGSLAPKLKRKGGCCDHGYRRPQEPWERTDGCVYLMRELAAEHPAEVAAMLPVLAEVTGLRHFNHHNHLLETIWKQLPAIAEGVGKKLFKRSVELFIDSLHYSLQSNHHLSQAAAEQCVQRIAKLIGPSILKGRVEMYDSFKLPVFERAMAAP